ncbi:N-6 DNA methylase [Dactylosporangium darangshiense]|uniref:N-6 DNA methylase n=1 Tax=Dactylosporangium darangshiense TaxID=579108 RepID=UPI003626A1A7
MAAQRSVRLAARRRAHRRPGRAARRSAAPHRRAAPAPRHRPVRRTAPAAARTEDRGQPRRLLHPQPVAEALARMLHVADATPGQSIADPAAGTGIMLWAAAHILRQHGKDPADYHWYANDIDPLAAACLAVNAHLWALGPNVLIGCADGLDPAWPHYAAVDRATGLDIARTARAFAALNALTSPPEPQ